MIRRILQLLVVCALVAAPLGGCGKKGPLEPPPDKKSDYPRQYPL